MFFQRFIRGCQKPDWFASFGARVGPTNVCRETKILVPDLKQLSWQFRLSNDTQQCAAPNGIMQRNRYGCCRCFYSFLHDPITASLTDLNESMRFENSANRRTRRTRSLPNRHLDLRHEDFVAVAPGDFRRVRCLEKKSQRLDQISAGLFDGCALARDIELREQRYKAVVLSFNDCSALRSLHDPSLQGFPTPNPQNVLKAAHTLEKATRRVRPRKRIWDQSPRRPTTCPAHNARRHPASQALRRSEASARLPWV
jgi:hypothetical protein